MLNLRRTLVLAPTLKPAPSTDSTDQRLDDAGESLSFDRVFRDHARTVARWAAKLGGERADVDELVQNVFMVVNRRLSDFRGEAKLTTWLYRITAKIVANDRRARRRALFWHRLTRRIEERVPATGDDPAEALQRRRATTQFYEVLDRLPERSRQVLVLFELEQMGSDEIAHLLGEKPVTVRVWLHRARAQFATRWADAEKSASASASDATPAGRKVG